jgi:inosine-uridine nucleoside N-ribohydrolase
LCLPDQSKLFIIPIRIIIDTDPGIDDALALILARHSPGVELQAVTLVGGNVSLDQCVRSACGLAGGVRVAKGLMPPRAEAAGHIHGEDGLGGAWQVPGNVLPEAEYNVWCDPESAQAVYESGVPVTAVGLDVTRQVRADTNQLSNASEFVQRMCSHPGWSGYLHDPLAVGVAFDQNLVRTESGSAVVDSSGRTRLKGTGSVQVAMEVDARRFVDLFLSRIASQ